MYIIPYIIHILKAESNNDVQYDHILLFSSSAQYEPEHDTNNKISYWTFCF